MQYKGGIRPPQFIRMSNIMHTKSQMRSKAAFKRERIGGLFITKERENSLNKFSIDDDTFDPPD